MKRRPLALLLAALGVAAIVLGVLSATAWRASNVVAMSTPQRPAAPVLVTDPGVLELMPGDVEITATADEEQPLTLIIARTEEVAAWVGASPHVKVTGAADWETLGVEDVPLGEGGTETVPSPSDVDGWPTELTEPGTVTTTWVDEPGRWSVLALTDGTAPAPELTLSWQREVSTPWLWPGVVLGVALLAAGITLYVRDEQKRRRRAARQRELGDRASRRARADSDATSVMPAVRAGGSTAVTRGALGTDPVVPVAAVAADAPARDDEATLPAPPVWTREAAEPADALDAVAAVGTVADAVDSDGRDAGAPVADGESTLPAPPVWTREPAADAAPVDVDPAGVAPADEERTLPAPPVWTSESAAADRSHDLDDDYVDDEDLDDDGVTARPGRHAAPEPEATLPAPPAWPREKPAGYVWTTDEPGGPPPLSRMARRARQEGEQR